MYINKQDCKNVFKAFLVTVKINCSGFLYKVTILKRDSLPLIECGITELKTGVLWMYLH